MNLMKRYLTDAEQARLLQAVHCESDLRARRDYWWICLLIATGARVGEFAQWTLPMAESALRTGWLVVPASMRKGGKQPHEYLVTQTVRKCLAALCFSARADAGDWPHVSPAPLVWGRDGAPLSVRSYQARFKQWAQAAELPPQCTTHWLRHTRGMNVLRRSRSANALKVVQQALGHKALSSTGVYLSMNREELEAELHAVDGGRMSKRQARRAGAAA